MIPIAETTNCADREMKIGQYYLSKREQVAAVGRFKSVITQCPRSLEAEEAMAHLTELGLELGVPAIAQNAVAVLESKFPSGRWTIEAHDRLRSAGLEPTEDERSWVVKAFR
jgi:outer membrane protein assembly factor BamD